MNNKIKIITLGDIFRNIETEEKAFEFLNYIQNLQQENERLKIEKQEEYNRFNLMSKFRDKALERELIYKSRNEKAIEELESYAPNTNALCDVVDNAINILKGE